MKVWLKTFRLCVMIGAMLLTCAALAQTPAAPAPQTPVSKLPALPYDGIARIEAIREADKEKEFLRNLQRFAAMPPPAMPVEREDETPAPSAPSKPGKLGQEGIHVHGDWVIDVTNPDGTPAHHHAFHNAVLAAGAYTLEGFMSGQLVPGDWMVLLNGATTICADGLECGIVQSLTMQPATDFCLGGPFTLASCTANLTTYWTGDGAAPNFSLMGSVTAVQAGSINSVTTLAGTCFTSTATPITPQACATVPADNASPLYFSGTGITAIPVAVGQVVQVKVTFTFS